MTIRDAATLKSFFDNGDFPNQSQFADLIDTLDANAVNVKAYGAVGNGIADDYAAIVLAVAAAHNKYLFFPNGTYLTSAKITIPDHIHIKAEPFACIKASGAMDYVLGNSTAIYATQHLVIEDIEINGNDLATYGLYLYFIATGCEVNRVRVHDAVSHGVYAYKSMCMSLRDVYSHNNGGSGFYLEGCNASNYYNIRGTYNTLDGITILSAVSYASDCGLYGGSAESNDRHGLYVYNCANTVLILGLHVEQADANTNDPVLLEESVGVMIGGRISGYGYGTNYCIHLTGTTRSAWYLAGNKVARNTDSDGSIATVKDDASFASTIENQITSMATMYRFHNEGAAVGIADGGAITHGISGTPTKIFVSGSVAGEIVTYDPATITSAHFHVNIKKNDGSPGTNQTISWRAEL